MRRRRCRSWPRPDGVLLSQETVNDFQLKLGDLINLRLQNAKDHQYHQLPFQFIGVVREFSTAPKDSFILANEGYIASQTGDPSREVVLIRGDIPPAQLAERIKPIAATIPGARVTDLGSVLKAISSSLTAVDLHGLTWIELSFAILLIAGASGLVLGLGLIERRRDFALLAAMGAKGRQLGSFLWTEGLIILISGMLLGFADRIRNREDAREGADGRIRSGSRGFGDSRALFGRSSLGGLCVDGPGCVDRAKGFAEASARGIADYLALKTLKQMVGGKRAQPYIRPSHSEVFRPTSRRLQ